MLAKYITDQKRLMAELLTKDRFDDFELVNGTVTTYAAFSVDGTYHSRFFPEESRDSAASGNTAAPAQAGPTAPDSHTSAQAVSAAPGSQSSAQAALAAPGSQTSAQTVPAAPGSQTSAQTFPAAPGSQTSGDSSNLSSGANSVPTVRYTPWRLLRPFFLSVIRGKHTPLSLQFIFRLSEERMQSVITKEGLSGAAETISGMMVNLSFDGTAFLLTTGVSHKTFSMDRSAERALDAYILQFFENAEIELSDPV